MIYSNWKERSFWPFAEDIQFFVSKLLLTDQQKTLDSILLMLFTKYKINYVPYITNNYLVASFELTKNLCDILVIDSKHIISLRNESYAGNIDDASDMIIASFLNIYIIFGLWPSCFDHTLGASSTMTLTNVRNKVFNGFTFG